jgi:hypothetical protein
VNHPADEHRKTSARSDAGPAAPDPSADDPRPSADPRKTFDGFVTQSWRDRERSSIRFWAPLEVAAHWERALEAIRREYAIVVEGNVKRIEPLPTWAAALLLIHRATSIWEERDPESIPTHWRVLERDEHACGIPGCSKRHGLEVHHVVWRSKGGTDHMSNRRAVCHGHHQAIHAGRIRVRGRALHALIYEIGCEPGLPPLFRLHGQKILRRATSPARTPPPRAAGCGGSTTTDGRGSAPLRP